MGLREVCIHRVNRINCGSLFQSLGSMSHLQNLLLDTLLGTKHVDSAALIKLQERSLSVASPGFSVRKSRFLDQHYKLFL